MNSDSKTRAPETGWPSAVSADAAVTGDGGGPVVHFVLIEDNALDVRLIGEMLLDVGHGQFVLNGVYGLVQEAVEGIRSRGGVDLILADLSLPDSTGIETFRRLSQALPHLPIIVLSGHDDETLAIRTVHEGAQDYLVKNAITGRLLARSIAYAIERKRTELELRIARNDLERRVVERTQALQDSNQQLAGTLNKLGETQARMIQEERLHALEQMASGIAHDFNNALSPILAHTELLMSKPEAARNEEKLIQTLSKIHEAAAHCAEVVSRLREFYRPRGAVEAFAPVDVPTVLEDVILMTQPGWKDQAQARGASIRVETSFDNVPKIAGSKPELREMAMNLMLNAIDAIKGQGVIRLSAFEEKGMVCMRIRDNGVGMSREVAEHCMEPFFTTKRGQGSGLGLGVVHGIAQRHNAQIDIESLVGEGTEVTIRFPACLPREEESASLPTVYGLRILAAEDEPMIREVLAVYLSEDSHRVEMAADGTEAVLKLEKGKFDLLITDHSMPGVSGDKVAEVARNVDMNIRVLMLTGFGDLLIERGMPRLAVDALVPKPFTFDSLRRGISKAMAGR